MTGKHIVIVRTGGSIINFESYNCQELGLAKALTLKGIKVSLVFAASENKSLKVNYKGYEIGIYLRRFKAVNQALAWFDDIETLLDSLEPDVLQIHEFGMLMSWRVIRWAKKHNTPTCLIQGSYRPTQKTIFKQLEQLFNHTLGKYILSNCDAIGCKTKMAADYTADYTDKQTMLTPIGLDISKFECTEEYDWKARLGIDNDSDILLYVGNIEQRRNPLFLIDIIEHLPQACHLVIVGDGPLKDATAEAVRQRGLDRRCTLTGKLAQEQLPSLYRQSSAFVLASDYEIFGMVILEAMYFGLPVITTSTAGSQTLIENHSDGIIIKQKDASLWANAINNMLKDRPKLASISDNAKHKIDTSLTWDKAADKFVALYRQAMSSHTPK